MLRLILGRSGYGKSTRVYEELRRCLREGAKECFLFVPEQISFETERALVYALGSREASCVQIFSFSHMAEKLMNLPVKVMTDGARLMLMMHALSQMHDRLPSFSTGKPAQKARQFLEMATDCKQSAVSSAMLRDAARNLPKGTLRRKAGEFSLLLEAYDALVDQSGMDEQDMISALAQWLTQTDILVGKDVFIDGFYGFTHAEYQVIEVALVQARSVTVTLCTDHLYDASGGLDRFYTVIETARLLQDAARRHGCPTENPIVLSQPYRFHNDELSTLEATAFTDEQLDTTNLSGDEAVHITLCADVYEECTAVVRDIRCLLRTKNMRANRIAVTARDLSTYIGVLDAALEQAGVPFYIDRRTPVLPETLFIAVLTALHIATGDWRSQRLIRLMKTGLLGFSVSSAARLENYVFTWNISGDRFREEWRSHPREYGAVFDQKDRRELEHLNRLRRRLVEPLMVLSDDLKGQVTGKQYVRAVMKYIHLSRIDRMIARQTAHLTAIGEMGLSQHTSQVWEALMGLLDDMALIFEHTSMNAAQLTDLLQGGASVTDIGSIPQQMDAVQIGQVDRMRFSNPQVVFVLGANEGIFPAVLEENNVFSAVERRQLMDLGLPFRDLCEQHTSFEHFLGYVALSAPSDALFISSLLTLPDGSKGEPSSVCHTVTAHLPQVVPRKARISADDIETIEDAFERMAEGFYVHSPLSDALAHALLSDDRMRSRIKAMTRITEDAPVAFDDPRKAGSFFGDNMTLSATKVEKFYQCRFAYFCQYGLGAHPRRQAELGTLEFGTLAHFVMETVLPVYVKEGVKNIHKSRCFADAEAAVRRYVHEEMGGFEDKPGRFLYLLSRLQGVCGQFLWHAVCELRQCAFTPVDYELPISSVHNGISPVPLSLSDGTTVRLIGKIDRVDVYRSGGKAYVRVIDYKTGSKKWSLADVVEGLNLQLLVYMLTIWQNGAVRYGDVVPAGLLYMPSKPVILQTDGTITQEEIEKKRFKQMHMNGLLIDNEEVLRAMEPSLQGVFIPAKRKKSGEWDSSSSVMSLAEFGALGRKARNLLAEMAKSLREGEVDALPLRDATHNACRYCDYRSVCGHEDEDRSRGLTFDSEEEIHFALQKTEEGF